METGSVIAFKNCTKLFGKKIVLQDVSFSLEETGSFVSILGKSGSGKTTLIRLLAGLEKPDSGKVLIEGTEVSRDGNIIIPPDRRNIGFIFQDLALFPHFTVFENIAFGLKVKKEVNFREIVNDTLFHFGIEDLKNNYPNQLSGGQQQLVALARTMVLNPKILLMDEPLASLDVKLKRQIRQLIKQLIRERQINVLYVTHDHVEAMEMSDIILLLHDCRIEFMGSPEELHNSDKVFVKEFIEF